MLVLRSTESRNTEPVCRSGTVIHLASNYFCKLAIALPVYTVSVGHDPVKP